MAWMSLSRLPNMLPCLLWVSLVFGISTVRAADESVDAVGYLDIMYVALSCKYQLA